MKNRPNIIEYARGIAGMAIGGVAGYFIFSLLLGQGVYAIAIPGALVGLGCGMLSGTRSSVLAGMSAVFAVMLGFFIEWKFLPFAADQSLSYFIAHIHKLSIITLIMIAIGGICAFSLGRGRGY